MTEYGQFIQFYERLQSMYLKQARLKVVPQVTTLCLFLNVIQIKYIWRQMNRPIEWVIEATSRRLKISKIVIISKKFFLFSDFFP